jgi:hypothetical protein
MADREEAARLLADPNPPLEGSKRPVLHRAQQKAKP